MDLGMTKIDRRLSLEKEPRTLSKDQIQHAREEALYVINTKTLDEALSIFTQGLEPVPSLSEDGSDLQMDEQLSFHRLENFRDIATAPF